MQIELNAELRTDLGKGASRRLRRAAKMPAILYGGDKEPVSLALMQKDVRQLQDEEAFYTSIIDLKLDGSAEKVVVRDVQHHPYHPDMMHIDFQRVDDTHKLHMHVPLHFLGEEKSPGVKKQGGVVFHQTTEVEVECLPKDIPDFIEVDMSKMNVGDILHLSDLNVPAGVELVELRQGEDHDAAVCAINAPKGGAAADEEEGGEEEAEGGED